MAAKRQTSEEDLIRAGGLMLRLIMDAKAIGETLTLLLIERNVFSEADYAAKYEEVAARFQKGIHAQLAEGQDAMLLRLLQQIPRGRGQ